ncbi:MAG TPA: hypothetical protein VNQ77_07955 [Frankiaceae bacterium]|nr:hypothetical protein [Frankiaceae bacterium]
MRPAASCPITVLTGIRRSRMQGSPPIFAWSMLIRSYDIAPPARTLARFAPADAAVAHASPTTRRAAAALDYAPSPALKVIDCRTRL